MTKPLVIDFYCGLGGWTEGFLVEGWQAIGFDIERHDYGTGGYPGQLVLQDVCTVHGAQLIDADALVSSSPCQEFSYRAMPWKCAKSLPPPVLGINLFWQAFRIQQEILEACGRWVPLVAENVKGAQPWIGRSRANFGSFHPWGDVDSVGGRIVVGGLRFGDTIKARRGGKNGGGSWFGDYQTQKAELLDGTKCGGDWFNAEQPSLSRLYSSKSPARKAASAAIAKIPEPLSRYIARVLHP